MHKLFPPFDTLWKNDSPLEAVKRLTGEIYRAEKNRRTLRFEQSKRHFFAKIHEGVGWKEIFKNLLRGRLPVISAKPEWNALKLCEKISLPAPKAVAYGEQGWNPARRQSFIITESLPSTQTLESYCLSWSDKTYTPADKRNLIQQVATLVRQLHQAGINHRDLYLCHFHRENHSGRLFLIDFHRAEIHKQVPKKRLIKDLAALYFSTFHLPLTRRDHYRFIRAYSEKSLKNALKNKSFWRSIEKKALKIYQTETRNFFKHIIKTPGSIPWCLAEGGLIKIEKLIGSPTTKSAISEATWESRKVIAAFYQKRHVAEKILRQHQLLFDANIPVPPLLHHDWLLGGKVYVLIYDAENLSPYSSKPRPSEAINLLAQLHRAGIKANIKEENLFIRNHIGAPTETPAILFLQTHFSPIKQYTAPLSEKRSLKNFAGFLAEKSTLSSKTLSDFYVNYIRMRNFLFTNRSLTFFEKVFFETQKSNVRKKTRGLFDLKQWMGFKNLHWFVLYEKKYDSKNMRVFLKDPVSVLQGPTTKYLKRDKKTSVAIIKFNDHTLVVKCYHTNGLYGIKRLFLPTRAAKNWCNAHRLMWLNISAIKPVALLEKRFGPLRLTSYFISEYIPALDLKHHFDQSVSLEEQLLIKEKLADLFAKLNAHHLSHGDLKATNILMYGHHPVLLDLDAMRFHRNTLRWKYHHNKDRTRFLKNWEQEPVLKKLLEDVFSF